MTEKQGITTSELAGLTGLSVVTIQRYVRRYRGAFSPSAAMPVKGRRFTDDDVKKILFINDMTHQKKASEIGEMLKGEINLALFDVRQFVQMYRSMSQMLKIIEELFEDAKMEKKNSVSWASHFREKINSIENYLNNVVDKRLRRIEWVRAFRKREESNEAEKILDMFVEIMDTRKGKKYLAETFDKIFEQENK